MIRILNQSELTTLYIPQCRLTPRNIHPAVVAGPGPLDVRIKRLARQRDDLQDINRRLKLDLEEERNRAFANRGAGSQEELERYR